MNESCKDKAKKCKKCPACRSELWDVRAAQRQAYVDVNRLTATTRKYFLSKSLNHGVSSGFQLNLPLPTPVIEPSTFKQPSSSIFVPSQDSTNSNPNVDNDTSNTNRKQAETYHAKFIEAIGACIEDPNATPKSSTSIYQNDKNQSNSRRKRVSMISFADSKGILRTVSRYAATADQIRRAKLHANRLGSGSYNSKKQSKNSRQNSEEDISEGDPDKNASSEALEKKEVRIKSANRNKIPLKQRQGRFSVSQFIQNVKVRDLRVEELLLKELNEKESFSRRNSFGFPQLRSRIKSEREDTISPHIKRNQRVSATSATICESAALASKNGTQTPKFDSMRANQLPEIHAWTPHAPEDVMEILEKLPKARTEKEVDLLMNYMLTLSAFSLYLTEAKSNVVVGDFILAHSKKILKGKIKENSFEGTFNLSPPRILAFRELCRAAKLIRLAPNSTLFNQGEFGNRWYVILRGAVDVYVNPTAVMGAKIKVATLSYGQSFGEFSLISDKSREVTVVSSQLREAYRQHPLFRSDSPNNDILFLAIERQDYNKFMREIHQKDIVTKINFISKISSFSGVGKITSHLQAQTNGIGFRHINELKFFTNIAFASKWKNFAIGDMILKEGDLVSEFYFIKEGYVDIFRDVYLDHEDLKKILNFNPIDEKKNTKISIGNDSMESHQKLETETTLKRKFRLHVARKGPGEYFGEEFVTKWNLSNYLSKYAKTAKEKLKLMQADRGSLHQNKKGPIDEEPTPLFLQKHLNENRTPSSASESIGSGDNDALESDIPSFPSRISAKAIDCTARIAFKDLAIDDFCYPDQGLLFNHEAPAQESSSSNHNLLSNQVTLLAMSIFDGQVRLKNTLKLSSYHEWDNEKLKRMLFEKKSKAAWMKTRKKVLYELSLDQYLESTPVEI